MQVNPVTEKCWKCLSTHVKAKLNLIVRFEAIIKTTVVNTATFTPKARKTLTDQHNFQLQATTRNEKQVRK